MVKRTETITCPKCNGTNTYKSGKNASNNQMVFCRNCDKQLTLKKPDLSNINCAVCGKLGIRYRKPRVCKNCYQRKQYNRKQVEEALDFSYPDNFDLEVYLNYVSTKYISKRANIKRDISLYLVRLSKDS